MAEADTTNDKAKTTVETTFMKIFLSTDNAGGEASVRFALTLLTLCVTKSKRKTHLVKNRNSP
jgi:hypothetical protein